MMLHKLEQTKVLDVTRHDSNLPSSQVSSHFPSLQKNWFGFLTPTDSVVTGRVKKAHFTRVRINEMQFQCR